MISTYQVTIQFSVIPAKAGIYIKSKHTVWFHAFAGKTSGFPLEFIPYLIRGGNDKIGDYTVVTLVAASLSLRLETAIIPICFVA